MKNQISRVLFLLLALALTACGSQIPPDETKSASQSSTVTQDVPVTIATTLEVTTPTPAEPQLGLDTAYYDGIIVITQYYTFLGHGLHEEAYWLQSTPRREIYSVEEYVDRMKPNFKNVDIITIQPLNKWLTDQGHYIVPDPPGNKQFYVRIIAWGEGNMSGSVMSGDTQSLILTLVQEDGLWKIDSWATGLGFPPVDPSASKTPEPESILDIGYYNSIISIAQSIHS